MRRRLFKTGEVMFREGDASDQAYLVRSGRVEIVKNSPRGPFRLALLGPGDVLGEMGLLEERPRSASAVVVEDVVADAVNATEFAHMLSSDPQASLGILRVLFERLRAVNARLSEAPAGDGPLVALDVTLRPVTPEAERGLPAAGLLLPRFPFRVGRAPRPDESALMHFNELELPDVEPYVLSPNHFSVDLDARGVVIRDRGSLFGTVVDGERLGAGSSVDMTVLAPGEHDLVAGPVRALAARRASPFRFRLAIG